MPNLCNVKNFGRNDTSLKDNESLRQETKWHKIGERKFTMQLQPST